MFGTWTAWVLKHRWGIAGLWACIALLGLLAGPQLSARLTAITDIPGSPSAQADAVLNTHFDESADGSFLVTYKFVQATDDQIDEFKTRLDRSVQTLPSGRVLQQRAVGGTLYAYVGSSLALSDAAEFTDDLRASLKSQGLDGAKVSGSPALEFDVRPMLTRDLAVGAAVAVVVSAALLILLLGASLTVVVPFLVAGATVSAGLSVLYFISGQIPMVLYTPNVLELLSLGLAIDYCLLVIHRLRQEFKAGNEFLPALQATMATAGRTVIYSGITVALGLAMLILVRVPFIQSLGIAGVLVPLLSLFSSLTLLPVLLYWMRGRLVADGRWQGLLARQHADSLWPRLARAVTKRPTRSLIACMGLLVVATLPVLDLKVAAASLTAVPKNLESSQALVGLADRVGPGVLAPHVVMIDTGRAGGATTEQHLSARQKLADDLAAWEGVSGTGHDSVPPFVDADERFLRIFVISRAGFAEDESNALVERLRTLDPTEYGFDQGTHLYVGGAPAKGVDFLDTVMESLPATLGLVIISALALLFLAFRSVVLPLKAVILNIMSVSATLGIVVAIFQWVLDVPRLELWALVLLFATLFGLSMDYHIFLVTRFREEWLRTRDNIEAIAIGMTQTGTVISGAAVIFMAALSGFVFGSIPGLVQFGAGLAIGVLLDATLVRGVLVPSAMVLLGGWNWWVPARSR